MIITILSSIQAGFVAWNLSSSSIAGYDNKDYFNGGHTCLTLLVF